MMKILKIYLVIGCGLAVAVGLTGCDKKANAPESDARTSINIVVLDDFGRPVEGAVITTVPPTEEVVTDEEGRAVLEDIPVRTYDIRVTWGRSVSGQQYVTPLADQPLNLQLTLIIQPPMMRILEPQDDQYLSAYNVRFRGNGTDNEDRLLPDSALVWYSDIDGELGHGETITVDSLTEGFHTITLEGTDSNNKKGKNSIQITAVDYRRDSYFPLPLGGRWTYQHPNPTISVMNENGQIEYWTMRNLTVSVDDLKRRNSLILYNIRIGNVSRYIRYYLMDYLEKEAGNIYVTKTIEQMTMWTGDETPESQTEQLDITTFYTPRYIILKNLTDPIGEGSYETTVRADVTRTYTSSRTGSETYQESFNVTTSVEVGDVENVNTALGMFSALGLTIYQEGSVRKWWLTPGLGLVRIEYNTLPSYPIATLYDTNLLPFYRALSSPKLSMDTSLEGPFLIIKTPRTHQGGLKEMMELCRFLKTLCPW